MCGLLVSYSLLCFAREGSWSFRRLPEPKRRGFAVFPKRKSAENHKKMGRKYLEKNSSGKNLWKFTSQKKGKITPKKLRTFEYHLKTPRPSNPRTSSEISETSPLSKMHFQNLHETYRKTLYQLQAPKKIIEHHTKNQPITLKP